VGDCGRGGAADAEGLRTQRDCGRNRTAEAEEPGEPGKGVAFGVIFLYSVIAGGGKGFVSDFTGFAGAAGGCKGGQL
jgi:hypothetical protein